MIDLLPFLQISLLSSDPFADRPWQSHRDKSLPRTKLAPPGSKRTVASEEREGTTSQCVVGLQSTVVAHWLRTHTGGMEKKKITVDWGWG